MVSNAVCNGRDILKNYADYCSMVHMGIWKSGKAVSFLCREVQNFIEEDSGHPYDILVISMPPQHGKSMTVTETLPSWYLCKNPHGRVIEISYNEELAIVFGRRNMQKLMEYGERMGVELAKNPKRSREFELENNIGGMISRGIHGGVTGRPCNLMIIDDPIKSRREADSALYRQRIYDEWENSFKTRLSVGGKVIIIQTRWHEDDLAGRIIQREKNVRVINLPCEAEEDDLLGRKIGDALAPEIGKDNKWLAEYKEGYLSTSGSRAWNALFQGRPTAAQGNTFNRNWWKYYKVLPQISYVLLSVDAAFKGGEDNDYVALQVWGQCEQDIYLLDAVKAHLDFPQTLRRIRELINKHEDIRLILIEDKANGSAIIQILKREFPYIVGVNPLGGKESRANAITGIIESGRVYLPEGEGFVGDFVEECTAFPNGKNDDQVDCMTQALNRLVFYRGKPPKKMQKSTIEGMFKIKKPIEDRLGKGEKDNVI